MRRRGAGYSEYMDAIPPEEPIDAARPNPVDAARAAQAVPQIDGTVEVPAETVRTEAIVTEAEQEGLRGAILSEGGTNAEGMALRTAVLGDESAIAARGASVDATTSDAIKRDEIVNAEAYANTQNYNYKNAQQQAGAAAVAGLGLASPRPGPVPGVPPASDDRVDPINNTERTPDPSRDAEYGAPEGEDE